MKSRYLQKCFLGLAASALLIGCGGGGSGGGGGGDGGGGSPSFKGLASLSGTLGVDKEGFARLLLDTDGDGKYDGKSDITASIKFKDGSFRFEGIKTLKDTVLQGQLIVTVPGYAPYQRIVSLHAGQSYVIDASSALNKPALKEVVSLEGLSKSARMGSVIQFGINKTAEGMQAFSRLISLGQLAAEDSFPVEDGRVSTYQFATASIPEDVKTVEATMQAFDSTKSEDIGNFPGSFRGYGQGGAKSAAGGDEVGLASAAFDLLVLKDQNGQEITLKTEASKLGANVDLSNCVNKWIRHVSAAQVAVINSWGDYDVTDPGYQVPIWSNDNSESAWKFVGVANFDEPNNQFEMCIPDDWGSGYLNCDSPIAFEKPVTLCVNATDQGGAPLSSVSVNGHSTSGEYASGYTSGAGHTSLGLADGNISKWSFTYSGYLTGWTPQTLLGITEVNTAECNYEANITLVSPYTADVKVTAKDIDGSAASNAYVTIYTAGYGHYLSKSAMTDANGTAHFSVEPNVAYTVGYKNGTAAVNVNGTSVTPETADSGVYADVVVQDVNQAPSGFVYLTIPVVNKDLTSSIPAEISGWDSNGDTVTRTSLKVDGEAVTLFNETTSSNAGSYWSYGDLNVTALSLGEHTLTAVLSDGSLSKTVQATFVVEGNRAPEIASPMEVELLSNAALFNIEESGSIIKAGSYDFRVGISDPDGDEFNQTMTLDGSSYTGPRALVDGSHTMVVTAKDAHNASSNKTFNFTVGNQAPVISHVVMSPNPINLHAGHNMTLIAYVNDPDGDGIATAVATTGSHEYNLTCNGSGSCQKVIDASSIGIGTHTFSVVATDGVGATSNEESASVVIRDENRLPIFEQSLYDITVPMSTDVTFDASATDPDNTRIDYVWKVDGIVVSAVDTLLTQNWGSEGTHVVTCTATDAEGGSATTTAHVTVIDPTKEVALTVKIGMPNIVVTAHDVAHGLKMIKSATTGTTGEVTLMLPAGTTTTAFSLAFDPNTVATSDQVFDKKKEEVLLEAANRCRWQSAELNISQCATADWCALLADTDSIPAWTVDAAQLKDKDDQNVTGASVDTDSNGEINKAEFYRAALRIADKDSSGDLTWAELDDKELSVMALVGVPVKTYEFNLSKGDDHEGMQGEELGLNCGSDNPAFDINVTNASAYVGSVSVYGAGYGYGTANGANNFTTKVSTYMKDRDGNYDLTVLFYDESNNVVSADLLLDQRAADLSAGKQYDAVSLPTMATRDVNVTNDVPHVWLGVSVRYKDIVNMGYAHMLGGGMSRHFYDSRLHYAITANQYMGTATMEKNYEQSDYYGDGTLKTTYKASDYPMLDLDVNTSTGVVHFTGANTSKVNVSKVILSGYTPDANGYHMNDNYGIEIIRYADQTSDFDFADLNITEVFPSGIATVIGDAMDASSMKKVGVEAYDFKGKTAYEILDMKVSNPRGLQSLPVRNFRYKTDAP